MIEQWNIPKQTGVCAATGKPFSPGETFWTAISVQEGVFIRREYSEAAWNDSLRAQAFSSWKAKMPFPDEPPSRRLVDDEVILEFFRRLEGNREPDRINFRYVLGLLLVRKKVLKLMDIDRVDGVESLVLKEKGSDALHKVEAPALTQEALMAVRAQVSQILNLDPEEAATATAKQGTAQNAENKEGTAENAENAEKPGI